MALACDHLAPIAAEHELVVSHGNGPQIGLLALEGAAYEPVPVYPLDVLGAETQGMIGYLVEQELGNRLPFEKPLATLLTMIEVDPDDPAFADPTKPIGPIYTAERGGRARARRGAGCSGPTATRCGGSCRRRPRSGSSSTVRSAGCSTPGCVVICAGGGGIPTAYDDDRTAPRASRRSSTRTTRAGCWPATSTPTIFVMATDAPGAFLGFGTPDQQLVTRAHPDALLADHGHEFAAGSMLPKVIAACDFARATGQSGRHRPARRHRTAGRRHGRHADHHRRHGVVTVAAPATKEA